MPNQKITISNVDALKPGSAIWDTEVRGFGVRCQRRDTIYVLKTRVNGRQRQFTIGQHGSPWTPVNARKEAQRLLGEIAAGNDPAMTRSNKAGQLTIVELAQRYLEEYAVPQKRSSSVITDRSNLNNHILPYFGKMLVSEVALEHINRFMMKISSGKVKKSKTKDYRGGKEVSGGKGVANRCRALLSKMFNLAEQWQLRAVNSNPVKHAMRFPENAVERYLSDDELRRLGIALEQALAKGNSSIHLINAIRVLLLTGARFGEIQTLKWEYVDQQRKVTFLPTSKTGKKALPLSDVALSVINATPRVDDNPYVFVGANDNAPIINYRKAWGRIRKEAGLDGLRIHDLRHNFASAAINAGTPLAVIQALLGHKNAKTTERYAHLADNVVHAASNQTSNNLLDILKQE